MIASAVRLHQSAVRQDVLSTGWFTRLMQEANGASMPHDESHDCACDDHSSSATLTIARGAGAGRPQLGRPAAQVGAATSSCSEQGNSL